jgi:hypothetical protein
MNRFDRRAALLATLGMLFLVEVLALSAGVKECGFGALTLMFLPLALTIYYQFPWVLLIFALLSVSVGFLWPRKAPYRTLVKLLFVIALIAVPTATFIVAPHTGHACTAI